MQIDLKEVIEKFVKLSDILEEENAILEKMYFNKEEIELVRSKENIKLKLIGELERVQFTIQDSGKSVIKQAAPEVKQKYFDIEDKFKAIINQNQSLLIKATMVNRQILDIIISNLQTSYNSKGKLNQKKQSLITSNEA